MNIQSRVPATMSIDAFFAWSEHQERRYELVDGVPRVQPYVRLNHNRVVMALSGLLLAQLDPDQFEATMGDFAVEVGPRSIRYADIMVIPAGKPGKTLRVTDAIMLIEVLSEGTMHVDFGAKLQEYLQLPNLASYLVLDQNAPSVWQWTRDKNGDFPANPTHTTEGVIDLTPPGVQLPLEQIYRRVKADG